MIFTIVFLISLTVFLYYKWTFNYWQRRGVKVHGRANLIFGNAADVVFRKIPAYTAYRNVYKKCVTDGEKYMGYYFMIKPSLVMADPELIGYILKQDFSHFTDRPFYVNKEVDKLSEHLISARGSRWKQIREHLSPSFTPSKLKLVFKALLIVGDQLIQVLDDSEKNGNSVKLKDICSKFVVDSIGMSILGINSNTLIKENKEIEYYASNTLGGNTVQSIKLLFSMAFPSVLNVLRIPFNSEKTKKFYVDLAKSTVKARKEQNINRKDALHSMILLANTIGSQDKNNSNDGSTETINFEEVASQILVLFGAGYETTSQSTLFLIFEIASNNNIQERLRDEILTVLSKYDGEITYEAISEMPYLEMCVKEGLRKYPGVVVLARVCTKNYQMPGTKLMIEKGTLIQIPILEIQRDSRYYPDPEKFDPGRFSSQNGSGESYNTYLVFGDGPRNCIAYKLSMIYIKIFVILLLKNYNMSINPKTILPLTFKKNSIIITCEHEIYLDIKKL